jgi:hypothetical protein
MVWFGEIEEKNCQIINDYLYLPFFLLNILWSKALKAAMYLILESLKGLDHEIEFKYFEKSVWL